MDTRMLRDALSSFATGVTVVTTTENNGALPIGMTASSFNSVSMDPPLVLWSVTKSALSAEIFRTAQYYAIHVLASDQVSLSNRFATRGMDKFDTVDYQLDANHIPCLSGVVTRFDCAAWNVVEGGDHWIIIGKVIRVEKNNKEPLVFSGGSYATASPLRAPTSLPEDTSVLRSPIDTMLLYNLSRAYHQMSQHFYHSVHDSGLSVPEWRILASLHSKAQRDLPDLAARTFIDAFVLVDMLLPMQEAGLCEVIGELHTENTELRICGTALGHSRVEHLFNLAKNQEQNALAGYQAPASELDSDNTAQQRTLESLVSMLQKVISNTC